MKDKTTPAKFMETWLLQMNYPTIEINLTRDAQNTTISFSQ